MAPLNGSSSPNVVLPWMDLYLSSSSKIPFEIRPFPSISSIPLIKFNKEMSSSTVHLPQLISSLAMELGFFLPIETNRELLLGLLEHATVTVHALVPPIAGFRFFFLAILCALLVLQ